MMEMLKEIDWNVKMKRFSRSHGELSELREIVDTMKNTWEELEITSVTLVGEDEMIKEHKVWMLKVKLG